MKAFKFFRKYPKTPDFDLSNYRLFERIPAVPGTSNNRGLTLMQKHVMKHGKLHMLWGVYLFSMQIFFNPLPNNNAF